MLEAVLANGKYMPHAVSRSLESVGSKALTKGIEVIIGNLWDQDSLKTAIRRSEVVFRVRTHITFWCSIGSLSEEHELLGS